MYEMAKKSREAMKAKARRLAGESEGKVDSSTWSPAPLLKADIKTGARPIMRPSKKGIGESNAARDTKAAIGNPTRGAFKSGGAVKKDGGVLDKKAVGAVEVLPKRGATPKPYKKGGRIKKLSGGTLANYIKGATSDLRAMAEHGPMIFPEELHKMNKREVYSGVAADKLLNKIKGKSGTAEKRGGRIKRKDGGADPSYVGASSVTKDNKPVTRPKDIKDTRQREPDASDLYTPDQAKRVEQGYKKGGKAKKIAKKKGGGVGLTVVIADKGGRAAPQGMTAPIAPRAVPVPPAAQMPPAPPPMPAAPPPAPVPMGRKAGGRITKVASSYKDMEAGSASGEGRLQKTDIAKKQKGAPTS